MRCEVSSAICFPLHTIPTTFKYKQNNESLKIKVYVQSVVYITAHKITKPSLDYMTSDQHIMTT